MTLADPTRIASLTAQYEVITVPANSELQTLDDLMAALEADPGAVSWAGGPAGGTDHMLAGLIAQEAGVNPAQLNYIPYSGGGEALAAVLGAQVTVGVTGYSEWAGAIEPGEPRALALSAPERVEGIDVPTLIEQGVEIELANWRGLVAPPDLDEAQTEALVNLIDELHASPEWQDALTQNGLEDFYRSGDDFATFLAEGDARAEEILTDIGLVIE